MKSDEQSVAETLRKLRSRVERDADRCRMSGNQNIRHDCSLDQIGFTLRYPRINVSTDVGIRPAVESAVFDRSGVLGGRIITQVVALIDRGPERVGSRLQGQAYRISQSRC